MTRPQDSEVLNIDVDAVVRQRLPRQYRFIPRFIIRALERLIHQADMNRLLHACRGMQGSEFCRGVLSHLDVEWNLRDSSLPSPANSRVILISNHPLGGLDGLALIDLVARHYGKEPWFVVNDLLMAVKPLRSVFLPVNKHGRQSREEAAAIGEALRSDRPVIIFPAGLVSRRGRKGTIADLEWKKKFIDLAREYRRDIVPLHFGGRNSSFFYNFAKWRERVGIRFNFEMILLPRELFRARGSRFDVTAGTLVPHTSLTGPTRALAMKLRRAVYALSNK